MILFFYGPNTYASRYRLKQLIDRYQASDSAGLGLERIDAETLPPVTSEAAERVINAITSLPFLSEHRLVIIENILANAELAAAVFGQLDRVPKTTVLVFYERTPDERTKAFKSLKNLTKTIKFTELMPSKLTTWVQQTAIKLGGQIDMPTAQLLIQKTGTDQWRLSNELTKLVSFEPKISSDSIEQLVEPTFQNSIFDLVDGLNRGRLEEAIRLYRGLRSQKHQPLYVLSMIGWATRNLIIAKAAMTSTGAKNASEISQDFGLNPFVVAKALQAVKAMPLSALKKAASKIMATDQALKSSSLDDDLLMEQLLIDLNLTIKATSKVA